MTVIMIYDNNNNNNNNNNNISKKSQLDLSLSNVKSVWWLDWLRKKKQLLTLGGLQSLNELMTFKEKYHYTKIKAQRNA